MERVENECRKRTSDIIESTDNRRKIDNHIKLAETILYLFKSHNKSTIQWHEVHESLQ